MKQILLLLTFCETVARSTEATAQATESARRTEVTDAKAVTTTTVSVSAA